MNYSSEEEQDFTPLINKSIPKNLNESDRIIIGCLHIPLRAVKIDNEWQITITNNPFYNTIYKLSKQYNTAWVGLLKNYWEIDEINREKIILNLQKNYNIYVIKLSIESTIKLNRLITTVLEPHFHYISILHNYKQIKEFEDLWKVFKEFNEMVAKQIISIYKENNLIFLHDFLLLLTPSLIYH